MSAAACAAVKATAAVAAAQGTMLSTSATRTRLDSRRVKEQLRRLINKNLPSCAVISDEQHNTAAEGLSSRRSESSPITSVRSDDEQTTAIQFTSVHLERTAAFSFTLLRRHGD